jgi:H+/Cl- antiporter ClcA
LKTYVLIAGVTFGLLTLAHIWRIIVEPNLATDPWFILITLASAGLCVGAWWVARRTSRP